MKEKDIPFTIASASIKENIDFFIESFGLDRWIKPEDIVYDDGTYENKIAMFHKAADVIGIDMKDIRIYEDSNSGIRNAYDAGCEQIVVICDKENEEEFLKLTKEFGVDAVSKAYSNDEFSIYFFSCIEDQDKINSLMNSLKKKTKCDIIENFDLDNNELSTRTKTNSGYRKTTKSLKDLIQKRISKEEFSKINDKLDYELLNKNSIQEKIKSTFSRVKRR